MQISISTNLEDTHRITIDVLRTIGKDHCIQLSSLTTVVRVPPTSGGGRRKGASCGRCYG